MYRDLGLCNTWAVKAWHTNKQVLRQLYFPNHFKYFSFQQFSRFLKWIANFQNHWLRLISFIILPIASEWVRRGKVEIGRTHWRTLVDEMMNHPFFQTEYQFHPTDSSALFTKKKRTWKRKWKRELEVTTKIEPHAENLWKTIDRSINLSHRMFVFIFLNKENRRRNRKIDE